MVWRALFRHRLSLYVWAVLPSAAPASAADGLRRAGREVPLPPAGPVRKGREAPGGNGLRAGPASVEQRFRKLDAKMQGPQIALMVCRRETFRQHHLDRAERTAPVSVTSAPSTATLYETAGTEAFPDRAPERQALELRLHLAARMHELGIIDAQPAGRISGRYLTQAASVSATRMFGCSTLG